MSCKQDSCNSCEENSSENHDHSHDHNHGNGFGDFNGKKEISLIIIAIILFVFGEIFHNNLHSTFYGIPEYMVFLPAYIIAGKDVLKATASNFRHFKFFDEYFLMALATIGAIITHNIGEAVGVMIFFKIGEMLQDYSVFKSRKSIQSLLDIKPKFANIMEDDCIIEVDPEDVKVGDRFIVKPGEKVPLDGIIINDGSTFDTSPLTGESFPRKISKNENVLAGVINISSVVEIEATELYENSSVAKILHLVEHAEENKAKTAKFMTKFAKYYTPAVVVLALIIAIIPPIILPGFPFNDWLYRAMIFLVISCPCALVISIPLGYFGGIGGASKRGILVKGANYLDILAKVDTILFDKTGTLTKGNFSVTEIVPIDSYDEKTMLELAAYAEHFSTHPIASSVIDAYGKEIISNQISEFTVVPAHGINVIVKQKSIIAGNDKILHKFEIPHAHDYCDIEGTVIHMAVNGTYTGYLLISDDIKNEAKEMIVELKKLGVKNISILSGDENCIVESIANTLEIDEFHGCLLPEDKVEQLKLKKSSQSVVAFVGDGINDAPVMANSDVGIVMGALGSDVAIESADVVLMTDSLDLIPTAIKIARKTRRIIWQNIFFVFIVKVIFMILGAFGIATMWEAVFADVGVALIAIFNASRILNLKGDK